MMEVHSIAPVYNQESKILILGSFPSVVSRQGEFFYHHPQNRFWKVLSFVCQEVVPISIVEKKQMLLKHRIAVWDVIHSCTIQGSSDSSIENVVVNNIASLVSKTNITTIYTNGTLATKLYQKHLQKEIGIQAIALPSTSSANARYSLEALQKTWQERMEGKL